MPIKIKKYITVAQDIWQQESGGKRFVARCTNKAIAARIVKLLNQDLLNRQLYPKTPKEFRGEG